MSVEKVAVLGGGLMGSGIAESAAPAGIEVTVRDVSGRIGRKSDRGIYAHDVTRKVVEV